MSKIKTLKLQINNTLRDFKIKWNVPNIELKLSSEGLLQILH